MNEKILELKNEGIMNKLNEAENIIKYLNFKLGDENYAIPLSLVKEVVAPLPLTVVPNYPQYYKGIIDLRGQIIPILDLKLKMKINKSTLSQNETAFIIVNIENNPFGLVTDSVDCVTEFKQSEINEPPANIESGKVEYINGIVKHNNILVLTLNINNLIKMNQNSGSLKPAAA